MSRLARHLGSSIGGKVGFHRFARGERGIEQRREELLEERADDICDIEPAEERSAGHALARVEHRRGEDIRFGHRLQRLADGDVTPQHDGRAGRALLEELAQRSCAQKLLGALRVCIWMHWSE